MIDADKVVYDYPSGRALHGVSFVLRPGAVMALVGPNGAGKSTLLRCLAALDMPTQGQVTVVGLDTRRNPREVHAALGYLPDIYGLYDALTVRRALVYAARARGVAQDRAEAAAAAAAARVELSDRMETPAGALSRGLRQRLAIAQAIVHGPRVLLLDEPASGLDPDARQSLSALIRSLARDGMTIVVSSHILSELEDYCTEMLMLEAGRAVGDGVVKTGGDPAHGAPLARVEVAVADAPPDLAARLAALGLVVEHLDGDRAVVRLPADLTEQAALARIVGAGLAVRTFAPVRNTLETTYRSAHAAAASATAVPQVDA